MLMHVLLAWCSGGSWWLCGYPLLARSSPLGPLGLSPVPLGEEQGGRRGPELRGVRQSPGK